ncbi:PQQ-binding-like beta-propeller repeat protein [Candidatus Latescibacterota bacterium]
MRSAIMIAGLIVMFSSTLFAQGNRSEFEKNWHQFRGPDSNQLPSTTNLPVSWSATKNLSWTYELPGSGWSSPIIWGNRVFVATAISDDQSQEQRAYRKARSQSGSGNSRDRDKKPVVEYSYELHCLDLDSGKVLWKKVAYKGVPYLPSRSENTHANETPATDGKRVYVYFGMIGLFCYDFEGKILWQKDLGKYPTASTWGAATSPIIYNDHLYMQIDNEESSFLVDLDPATGNERWRVSRDEKTSYSTPIIWKNSIRTELVTGSGTVRSYEPDTGKQLWELNVGGGRNISSPVAHGDILYAGNEGRRDGGGTLFAVKAGANGDITPDEGAATSPGVLWSVPDAGISMASPLVFKGGIYLVDRRGGFINCYDAVSGEPYYQRTRIPDAKAFWATPWGYDNKVFCLDDAGTTFVVQPGNEFKILYKNEIDDMFWPSAAFSEATIVLRGVENLYCIQQK